MDLPESLLREAGTEDVDTFFELFSQVQQLHLEAEPAFFRRPEKDEHFDAYFSWLLRDPAQHLVISWKDGKAIGYIQYFLGLSPKTVYQPERRIAHIAQVFVAPDHRRSGVATRLIEHVIEQARRVGATQAGMEMWVFNEAARACFEKFGFRVNQASMWRDVG